MCLGGAAAPKATTRAHSKKPSPIFLHCSRAKQTLLNFLIFFFPPNISKAQGPSPALLRTGLSFSHRGCLEELDETRVRQISAKTNPQRMTQNSSVGFLNYYSKEDAAQKHWMTCQAHQVTYDNSSRNKKLLWARAVVLLLVKAS